MGPFAQTIFLSVLAGFGVIAAGVTLDTIILGPTEVFVPPSGGIADELRESEGIAGKVEQLPVVEPIWPALLDTAEYDRRVLALAHYVPREELVVSTTTQWRDGIATTVVSTTTRISNEPVFSSSTNVTVPGAPWPAAAPYPHGGAILPFERVVAYYGNFFSTRMGILGEFPREEVLARLASTSAAWAAADPDTPVRPAIHYIAMVAQAEAGTDGMYRAVMPDAHIEQAIAMAEEIDGIVFLDLQVGLSTIERELPQFRRWFTHPRVHLGLDPEFSMKGGQRPGTVIGTFDAADLNFAAAWLAEIVREYELPPKILIIHRFTQNMVTNYRQLAPLPEVQMVMHMDGWGPRDLKRQTYRHVVEFEPVQFAGLKIFYKHDVKPPSTGLFSPAEALQLYPRPIYIQYQ